MNPITLRKKQREAVANLAEKVLLAMLPSGLMNQPTPSDSPGTGQIDLWGPRNLVVAAFEIAENYAERRAQFIKTGDVLSKEETAFRESRR